MMLTLLADAVVSVELFWKTKTECGLPRPSSVSVPVRLSAPLLGAAYTPPRRVRPPRLAAGVAVTARPRAFTYASVRSDCACAAAGFVWSVDAGGATCPGGNPVIDDPGECPSPPGRTPEPELVTVGAAS